jgi:hypothetical protein
MNFEQNPRRASLTTGSVALIGARWKLVRYLGSLRYPLMPQLHDSAYDLSSDPGELAGHEAETSCECQRLNDVLATELKRYGGPVP